MARLYSVLLWLVGVILPVLHKELGMEMMCVTFWFGFKAFNWYCKPSNALSSSWLYHLLELPNGCDTQDSPCQPLIVMCMREKSIFLSHYHWGLFVTRLWCNLFETSQAQSRELQYQGIWICLLIPKRLWMFKPQGGQRCIWTSGRAGTKNWVLQSSLSLLFLVCLALFSPITMLPSLHGER